MDIFWTFVLISLGILVGILMLPQLLMAGAIIGVVASISFAFHGQEIISFLCLFLSPISFICGVYLMDKYDEICHRFGGSY